MGDVGGRATPRRAAIVREIALQTLSIFDEKGCHFVRFVQVSHVARAMPEVDAAPCARDAGCFQPIRIGAPQVVRRELAAAFSHAILEGASVQARHRGFGH